MPMSMMESALGNEWKDSEGQYTCKDMLLVQLTVACNIGEQYCRWDHCMILSFSPSVAITAQMKLNGIFSILLRSVMQQHRCSSKCC